MKYRKNFFFIVISLITINLWLFSKQDLSTIVSSPAKSISQIAALLGVVYLGFELVLISRLKILEKLIGPLDNIYKYHRYLSVFSVIALVTHSITLIISTFPKYALAQIYIIPNGNNITYAAGIISLYTLILTVAITFYIKLPYHLWKLSHRILALSVILATYHVLTVSSDISSSILLRSWIIGSLVIGVASMIYKIFFYNKYSTGYQYIVDEVFSSKDVLLIRMQPKVAKMTYSAGQFAYFSFFSEAVSSEEHPFSLISNPKDDYLIIGVKKLGDYTRSLSGIQKGDFVVVRGGFGGFGADSGKFLREIWVGAGIGITPFLSLNPAADTKIFYCTKNKEDAVFLEELVKKAQNASTSIELINHQSETQGHFDPAQIRSELEDGNTCVRVCGPQGLLDSFKNYFERNKLPLNKLIYEDFSFLD